jgi:hypothetical protein
MTVVLRMLKELCEHFNLTATARSETFRRLIQRTDVGDLLSAWNAVYRTNRSKIGENERCLSPKLDRGLRGDH